MGGSCSSAPHPQPGAQESFSLSKNVALQEASECQICLANIDLVCPGLLIFSLSLSSSSSFFNCKIFTEHKIAHSSLDSEGILIGVFLC